MGEEWGGLLGWGGWVSAWLGSGLLRCHRIEVLVFDGLWFEKLELGIKTAMRWRLSFSDFSFVVSCPAGENVSVVGHNWQASD